MNQSYTTINLKGSRRGILSFVGDIITLSGFVAGEDTMEINLKENTDFIKRIEEGNHSGFSSMNIDCFDISSNRNEINIIGEGMGNSPFSIFSSLAIKYGLSGFYLDTERNDDFTHLIEFENGEISKVIKDRYFCDSSVEYYGIEYFLLEYDEIGEHLKYCNSEEEIEELKEEYKYEFKMFKKYGYGVKRLKEEWESINQSINQEEGN